MKKLLALLFTAAFIAGSNTNANANAMSDDFRTEYMVGYTTETDSGFIDVEGNIFSLGFVSENVYSSETYKVVMLGYDTPDKTDDEIVDFINLETTEIEYMEHLEAKANQIKELYDDVFNTSSEVKITDTSFVVYINGELHKTIARG